MHWYSFEASLTTNFFSILKRTKDMFRLTLILVTLATYIFAVPSCDYENFYCDCYVNTLDDECTLYCNDSGYDIVPSCVDSGDWKSIFLSNNNLTTIGSSDFGDLIYLDELDLSGNQISEIEEGAFYGLPKLDRLNLANNLLEQLDSEDFEGATSLTQLFLANNVLYHLRSTDFVFIPYLVYLELQNNKIEIIDDYVFKDLTNLKEVYLNDNKITKISSKMFSKLTLLQVLDLSGNMISSIEDGTLWGLRRLDKLDLQSNKIESIEDDVFRKMTNLTELYINDNKLTKITQNMFSDLFHLQELYLYQNHIADIHPEAFHTLSNLKKLKVSSNYLTTIDSKLFKGLRELTHLYIYDNKIRVLEPETFRGLHKLQILKMSYNRLSYLHPDLFIGLSSLIKLHINDNIITHLSIETFYMLHSLQKLYISQNPFNCTCSLKAFSEWINLRKAEITTTLGECSREENTVQALNSTLQCPEKFSMFGINFSCAKCYNVKSHVACKKKNTTEFCDAENPVCYTTTRYNGRQLTITKGCSSDRNCQARAQQINEACYPGSGQSNITCKFCCVGEQCNHGNLGLRTTEINFSVLIEIYENSIDAFNISSQELSSLEPDVFERVTKEMNDINGVASSFDVKWVKLGEPMVKITMEIISTALEEANETLIMQALEEKLRYEYFVEKVTIQLACGVGKFGPKCNSSCNENCVNNECDDFTGSCIFGCTEGWVGLNCDTKTACNDGKFRPKCNISCSENCVNKKCDYFTGSCSFGCIEGWEGLKCETKKACNNGKFGPECNFSCNDNCVNKDCDGVTGSCRLGCTEGLEGLDCETKAVSDGEMKVQRVEGATILGASIGVFALLNFLAGLVVACKVGHRKVALVRISTSPNIHFTDTENDVYTNTGTETVPSDSNSYEALGERQ